MATQTSPVPDQVRDSVRVLAAYRNKTQAEVLLGAGIPKSRFIRRMRSGGWTVSEVRALAAYLGVEPSVIINGPDPLFQAAGLRTPTSGLSARNRHSGMRPEPTRLAA